MVASVSIWGMPVGAVLWDNSAELARFEYEPSFLKHGLDLAPLTMPLAEAEANRLFSFPALSKETFKGLPGLLCDSLPDTFGNKLIDAWLARQGRDPGSVNPVERLCYTGRRGMGALEFEPASHPMDLQSNPVDISELVNLAREILGERKRLKTNIHKQKEQGLWDIIRVGTSAGGARAKAVIAYNETSGDVVSGQVEAGSGYSYWLIKFDGVVKQQLSDAKGYGRIEYAYYKMALDCGILMSDCRLLEENGRAHFMTRRFDRTDTGDKLHMQTLCGMAHFDYNQPDIYAYEQAFQVMRQLRLPYTDAEQFFRRMVFNVVARNLDDHTKNTSFLMDRNGTWSLSPAYDVAYAYDPASKWVSRHQMSVNGKRENISKADILAVAREMNIKKPAEIIESVNAVVSRWPAYAKETSVSAAMSKAIAASHILML